MGQDEAFAEPSGWRAENVPDGLVLFHGEDIEPGEIDPIENRSVSVRRDDGPVTCSNDCGTR